MVFKKGHTPYKYWLGKYRSEETKKKISETKKGKKKSKEWTEKMKVWLKSHQFKKGEYPSPETEFKEGHHPETEFKKGHPPTEGSWKKGHIPYNKGLIKEKQPMYEKSHSKKSKKLMSKKVKESYKKYPHLRKLRRKHMRENNPLYNPKIVKKVLKKVNKRPNMKEQELINLIQKNNFPYRYVGDGEFILGRKCPDFLNCNGQKKLIELFGDYWHKSEDEIKRIKHFAKYGFQTLIIWEHELKQPEIVVEKVKDFEDVLHV